MVFALDEVTSFDPLDLDVEVTPSNTLKALEEGRLLDALMMALRLNEATVLRAVYERVPPPEVPPPSCSLIPNAPRSLQRLVSTWC